MAVGPLNRDTLACDKLFSDVAEVDSRKLGLRVDAKHIVPRVPYQCASPARGDGADKYPT
jgi:hypothetical protein